MDTGALFALYRRTDVWHDRVKRWMMASRRAVLLVPAPVLQETAYLMGAVLGAAAEAAVLRTAAAGELALEHLESADLERCAALIETYDDLNLGFVDSSIVALAERLDIEQVLTTDRRHFGAIRPAHCRRLKLLP